MGLNEKLAAEFKYGAEKTRQYLELVPENSFGWKPHEKSMSLGRLASHIAELPEWLEAAISQDELDFATSEFKTHEINNRAALMALFEKNVQLGVEQLMKANDEILFANWRLRNGDKIYFEIPRIAVIRDMIFNHIIHHRGQLSVYLRMKGVPLPPIFGPTADVREM